jgi:hypothetical protein
VRLHGSRAGGWYLKRPVPGIGWVTWQVSLEGRQLLAREGIDVGSEVSPKVFNELHCKGYLYTNQTGPTGEVALERASKWGGAGKSDASATMGCFYLVALIFAIWLLMKMLAFFQDLF